MDGSTKTSIRTIYNADVKRTSKDIIEITLTGNGFLYNMVRIIAGTLIEVGEGKIEPEYMKEIMDKKDRSFAGKTVSPNGLFLVKVDYDNE